MDFAGGTQESAGQHGRQRQGDEAGHEHGHADRDGELPEQPADQTAHEEDRDEHGGQRERHAHDREADLLGAVNRRLERGFAHFHVPHDVLEHDDGIVHNEADRQRQGHQRKVVEAVAAQVHDDEGPDDRHGQGQARDHRGRYIAEEQEDDEHDQKQGQQQGVLDVL